MEAHPNTNEVVWWLVICFCFPTQLAFDMQINIEWNYYYFWARPAAVLIRLIWFDPVSQLSVELGGAKISFWGREQYESWCIC